MLDAAGALQFVRGAVLVGTAEVYAEGGRGCDLVILLSEADGATYCKRPNPARYLGWFATIRAEGERLRAYGAVVVVVHEGSADMQAGVMVVLEHVELAVSPSWWAPLQADGRLGEWEARPGSPAKSRSDYQILTRRMEGAIA